MESIATELKALNQKYRKAGSKLEIENEKLSELNSEKEISVKNSGIFNISKNLKPGELCPICGNVIQHIVHKTACKDFSNEINRLVYPLLFEHLIIKQTSFLQKYPYP